MLVLRQRSVEGKILIFFESKNFEFYKERIDFSGDRFSKNRIIKNRSIVNFYRSKVDFSIFWEATFKNRNMKNRSKVYFYQSKVNFPIFWEVDIQKSKHEKSIESQFSDFSRDRLLKIHQKSIFIDRNSSTPCILEYLDHVKIYFYTHFALHCIIFSSKSHLFWNSLQFQFEIA